LSTISIATIENYANVIEPEQPQQVNTRE